MSKEDTIPIPQPLTGYFVISESDLQDPNFQFTVVLIVNHDETGALGLVVNRPSNATLGEIFSDEFSDHSASHTAFFIGGPVQQEYIFAVQKDLPAELRSEAAVEISPGLVFEPDVRMILDHIRLHWDEYSYDTRPGIRFFAGYSGWAPGQLEEEIQQGAWTTLKASSDIIFSPNPEQGWRNALKRKGGLHWIMGETGSKPSMN